MDDTYSINCNLTEEGEKLLVKLNNLHPALEFTCEDERDRSLPFLDELVEKKEKENGNLNFTTTVYRKPTFTGQYTSWDSFSARKYKVNLVKCLTGHALKICSPCKLQEELEELRRVFENSGYPHGVVERSMAQVLKEKLKVHGPKRSVFETSLDRHKAVRTTIVKNAPPCPMGLLDLRAECLFFVQAPVKNEYQGCNPHPPHV